MPRNANQSKSSNYSLDFEGADYINCGDDNMFSFGNGTTDSPFSVSFWTKLNSVTGTQPFLSKDITSPNREWAISIFSDSSNGVRIFLKNQGGNTQQSIDSSTALTTGVWYHITTTYDGRGGSNAADGLSIYINGSLDTPTNIAKGTYTAMSNTTAPVYIGKYSTNEIDGKMTEVSIFDYDLSASQVATLYGTGSAIGNPMALSSPPIAYYPLDTSAWNGNFLAENNAIGNYVFDNINSSAINTPYNLTATSNITVAIWFKTTDPEPQSNKYLFSYGNSSSIYDLRLNGTNTVQPIIKIAGVQRAPNISFTYADGNWHQYIVNYDGSHIKVYIDGILKNKSPYTGNLSVSTNNFVFGNLSSTSSGGVIGEISNCTIHTATLTDGNVSVGDEATGEIATFYNYGSPVKTLSSIPQSSNLVLWHKLDAGEIYNSTSTEWEIENNASPTTFKSALDFDGSTDYIDGGNSSDFQFQANNSFTLSAWIYPTVSQANRQIIIGNRNWNTIPYQGWDFRTSLQGGVNRIEMVLDSGTTVASYYTTTGVSLNQWQHVVGVYDASPSAIGDRFSFYINGSLVGKAAASAQIPATITYATKLTVGAIQDQNGYKYAFWNGKISNVAIYNTALSASNITTLYNNGVPQATIYGSPVSHWKLDNTTTGIQDSAGSNNGTNNGATEVATYVNTTASNSSGMSQSNLVQSNLQTVAPYSKYTLNFDGTDDYIDSGNDTSLSISGNFTVSAWVYMDSATSYKRVVGKSNSANDRCNYGIGFENYKPAVLVNDGSPWPTYVDYASATALSLNRWYHIVGVYDGSNFLLYVNGVLDNTTSATGFNINTAASDTSSSNLLIGDSYRATENFDGKISNVSIWNTALTASQVREIYNQGLPGNLNSHSAYSNLVSWWQLGENSSFTNNWICADEKDSNNGTSVNMGVDALTNGVGTTANGTSTGMSEGSLVGNAPYSDANAISSGMSVASRVTGSGNTP